MDSSEIAEDFKDALQDLKVNSKPEIDTLTVIAKENTAHAQAISGVLEEHIKTTRPEWMLPALYVLDSLIRHVGPPYSTYLGANLYRTFMEMYRQVGNAIRKDMEAVLRTWKEPPQGSRNPRPVLPVEITEPIENALAKFRSITMQSQQPRPLPGQPPFRNSPQPGMMYHNGVGVQGTPTPVDMAALMGQLQQRTGTPTYTNTNMNGLQRHPVVTSPAIRPAMLSHILPPSQTSTPLNFAPFQAPTATPPQAHQTVTQDQLKNEVNQLLQSANIQKILDASNNDLPQLVSTLESLKSLLDKQQFMAPDLLAMQSELSKISSRLNSQIASILGNAQGNTPPPIPPVSRMPMNPYQTVSTPPGMLPFAPPPISFPPSLPPQSRTISPPPQNVPVDMASLLGLLGPPPPIPQPAPTPVFPGLAPQSMSQHSSRNTNSQPPAGGGGLLDMLRASGLLMGAPTPQQSNINFPIPPPSAMISPPGGRRYGVRLDQESITKTRRTHLVVSLYQAIPDQCKQCGRRFPKTEDGKAKKMKHLDWHFSINSRVANSAQTSIVHRSAYLDELQWTRLRETQDGTDYTDGEEAAKANTLSNNKEDSEVYVLPPRDAAKLNEPCSICMEPFKSVWHLKTQQPVWMDTVKVGNKYYHASCYKEATAGRGMAVRNGGRNSNRATPEPVLGKRKYANVVS